MAKRGQTTNKEVARPIEEARITGARELNLSGRGLSELPETIGQLSQLQNLALIGNRLTELPEAIGQLGQLQRLELDYNQLTELPDAMSQLRQLQSLDLRGNKLTELREAIGQLSQLQSLYLMDNRLTELPEAIGQLSQLQDLSLEGNRLTALPETIGQLSQLRGLYLAGNQLTALPDAIGQLRQLQVLGLEGNQLMALPESLRNLDSLAELHLHNNPGLDLPPEVLGPTLNERWGSSPTEPAANPQKILEYYFRTRGGRRPLNEAKLILVGYGAVGKTSLVNRLVHNRFDMGEKETEGINITQWPVSLHDEEHIRLHIWDFGGQEIMHSTHQFFLTQRSLYLLVLNGRQGHEDADADYWLNLIESFGEGSPVIVVLNKIKEHSFDVNRRGLRQKFAIIRDFVETDCEDETGIAALKQAILRETDRLEHLRDAFPANWFGIKDQLASMEANYISYDEYRKICRENGEGEGGAQESLASYLHSLGIALNYKDDPRLRDTHVLNPRWVTNGIYKILNAEDLARRKGELQLDALTGVLDPNTYPPERHGFLLELMRKFELCFTFPDDQGRYLVPELLDKQQPEGAEDFRPEQCLNFQYHYSILPEGLLPRFIVRTHVLSTGQPRWRMGVILEWEGNRAVVKGDKEDKRVFISVQGPESRGRRELLAVIRHDFEHIHRSFKFTPQEMVPVPDVPEVLVSYQELLVMERKGIWTFPKVSGDRVLELNVGDLLNGVDLEGARRVSRAEREDRGIRVFCSYSHKDEDLRAELETHLKLLQRQGVISLWHDRRIPPGDEWKKQIDEELNRADIISLLVSSDFLASDYCYDIEVDRAMARHDANEARVIPVVVRDVAWHKAPFAKCQALPKEGKAVTLWGEGVHGRDSAWRNVAEGIEQAAKELRQAKG
jgi:internalin A